MRHRSSWWVGALALVLVPGAARADCAEGAGYQAAATGNTVTVCLEGTARTCGGSVPMLRQDEATGALVQLGGACDADGCYLDECVPPGTYRYGFATAFDCSESGCGSPPFFTEVTVTSALSSCTPTSGNPAPTPTTVAAPWGSGTSISDTESCSGGCMTARDERGSVLAFDMLALGLGLLAMRLHALRGRKTRRP